MDDNENAGFLNARVIRTNFASKPRSYSGIEYIHEGQVG